jgi:hypothetical protein
MYFDENGNLMQNSLKGVDPIKTGNAIDSFLSFTNKITGHGDSDFCNRRNIRQRV